jgi:hypothetical protein
MPNTSRPTISAPRPVAAVASFAKNARMPNTRMNVPITSVIMLLTGLRIAGAVLKHASFRPGSSVAFQ